jgi:hypothetical protein
MSMTLVTMTLSTHCMTLTCPAESTSMEGMRQGSDRNRSLEASVTADGYRGNETAEIAAAGGAGGGERVTGH